jgi:hypothetical protein
MEENVKKECRPFQQLTINDEVIEFKSHRKKNSMVYRLQGVTALPRFKW